MKGVNHGIILQIQKKNSYKYMRICLLKTSINHSFKIDKTRKKLKKMHKFVSKKMGQGCHITKFNQIFN